MHTDDYVLFDRKIQNVTAGLIPYFQKLLYTLSKENAWTIANYIMSMKTEMNLTDNYRRDTVKVLAYFSIFYNNKSFKQITRHEYILYLYIFASRRAYIDCINGIVRIIHIEYILLGFSNG